jgi:hypothetical protein
MPGGGDQWRLVKQITTPDITIEGFPVKGGPGFIYINLLPSGDDLTLKLTYHYTGYGGVLGFSAAIGVGCQETVNYRINAIGGADILCPPFLPITLNVVSATTGNHLDPATYGLRYQDGGNGYAVPGTNPDSGDPSVMEHCPGAETSTATIESF